MSYIAYIYLALPFLIFVIGWFRPIIAIPSAAAIIIGLTLACRHAPRLWMPKFDKNSMHAAAFIVMIALIWVYFSGIGGHVYQNYDHKWRNAIFKLLVEEDWPVILTETDGHFERPVALVYYFAFWLPSAAFGKLFGLTAGYGMLFAWAVIGVILVFYFICASSQKPSIRNILIFVFFSGLDIIGRFILTNSSSFIWFGTAHIENWAHGFQFSSITTQLFWVFNQAIPAWLITLMLPHQKNNRSMVFLYSFSLLSCSLPAIGMIPLFAVVGIKNCIEIWSAEKGILENLRAALRDVFTFQNLVSGGIIGITSYLFLKINTSGQKFDMIKFGDYGMSYLLFVFFEFLILCLFIRPQKGKRILYYTTVATLLLIPFFRLGSSIDFVMRASIPALVLLCTYTADTLDILLREKKHLLSAALCAILILGAITAQTEFSRTAVNTVTANRDGNPVTAQEISLVEDGHRNNFFGEYEDSIFFRYIAKRTD